MPDNENYKSFKKTVSKLAKSLNKQPQKEDTNSNPRYLVNGVFLGWQGARSAFPLLENAFFYKSKNISDEVSRGHMNLVIQSIDRFHQAAKSDEDISHSFVVVGHSFGGRILFNMTSSLLYADTLDQASNWSIEQKISPTEKLEVFSKHVGEKSQIQDLVEPRESPILTGFGDLIVLLNPAFEANRYVLLDDLHDRIVFNQDQSPVLYQISTSKDIATHFFFPLSRWFETIVTNRSKVRTDEHRAQVTEAVGNFEPFRTHQLFYRSPVDGNSSIISDFSATDIQSVDNIVCEHGTADLAPIRPASQTSPFVIAYDEKGQMMKSHNDIFNDCVAAHLLQVILRSVSGGSSGSW